jgi:hypothetical protein
VGFISPALGGGRPVFSDPGPQGPQAAISFTGPQGPRPEAAVSIAGPQGPEAAISKNDRPFHPCLSHDNFDPKVSFQLCSSLSGGVKSMQTAVM